MERSVHSLRSKGNQEQNFASVSQKSLHSQRQIEAIQKANFDKLVRTYQGQRPEDIRSQIDNKVQVLSQEIIPLIKAYSQQNSKLKQEKKLIADEMERLEKITEILLDQNEQMHQHSNFRILDLKKIAESISLNLGESENDIRHRIHLYTEQNNSIIRALGELQKQSAALDFVLNKTEMEKGEINRSISETQFKILESSARSQDLQNKVKSLKYEQENLKSQRKQISEKLDDYVLDNNELRTYNRDAVHQLQNQKQQLGIQKPRIITQNVKLHSDIIQLKTNQKSYNQQIGLKQKQKQLLSNNIEKQKKDNQQKQNSVQNNNFTIITLEDRVKRIEKQIEESQAREKQAEQEWNQLMRKKEELIQGLQAADSELQGKQKVWNDNLKQNRGAKVLTMENLNNSISKKMIAFAHEKATLEYNIKQIKSQIQYVNQEADDRQQSIYQIKKNGETIGQFKKEISKLESQIAQQDRKLEQRRA